MPHTRLNPLSAVLAALLALFLAFTAEAQVVGGTLSGTISDATGAALKGATVLVHNEETGSERRMVTGLDGRYAAPSIAIGTYTVAVEASGFAPKRRTAIPLTIGESKQVD